MDIDLKKLTDIREKGAEKDGERQYSDKRLFMQLLVFTGCEDEAAIIKDLETNAIEAVLYRDVNDPKGIGLLTMSEAPEFFTTTLRDFIKESPLGALRLRRKQTLFGRTYSLGHEEKLEDWLLHKPRRVAGTKEWPWAVWYPLRRKGEFAALSEKEQGVILREHGMIGRAFGQADYGHDIRLSSFGLDSNDNDFVVGLIGKELYPLSVLVQTMRSTKQTSTYMEKMGPFFVGKVLWQSPLK